MSTGVMAGELAAKVLLASVFAIAGVVKLADLPGSRRSLVDFGVPVKLAGPLAVVQAACELTAGVALAVPSTAGWGAAAMAALSVVSGSAMVANVMLGRRPSCHCFGALYSAPIGRAALIRVTVLGALAAVVAMEHRGHDGAEWPDALIMVAVAFAIASTAVALRVHQTGSRVRKRVPPPTVGHPAPAFSATDLVGRQVGLEQLLASGRPVALVFVEPRCRACADLLPDFTRWQRSLADYITIVLLSEGRRASRDMAMKYGLSQVLLQRGGGVGDAYGVSGTPSAVLVDAKGNLLSRPVRGDVGVRALLASLEHRGRCQPLGGDSETASETPVASWTTPGAGLVPR